MAARSGATDGPVGDDDAASHQLHRNAADDDDNTVVVADTASATAAAVGAAAESELMLLASPPRAFAAVNSIEPLRSSSSSSSSISTAHGSRSPVGSPVDEMPSVSLPPPAASAGGGDSALDGDPASPTADDDVSWGRTDTGLVFPVPPTQPLWQALFFPANHQSVFEWSVLTFVGIGIFLFLALPLPPLFFLCAFLFWRFCYNVGLGLILWRQSSDKAVVRLVRRLGFGPNAGRRRGPWTAYFVREIQKKVNISDEEYDALPLDFISWMLFRGVADVVIANDLVAYILFALCYFEAPANGVLTWMDVLRYTAGVIMIVVNYWAKFEVDQTLLDYAWYWGDFFFLMDASPTHSGLFEAAPHPMYIVGFLGYYATALITKSYTVLFVSLLAHSMQLGFLFLVENPHMEKTYNRPFSTKGEDKTHDKMIMRSFFQRDLVIFRNFDLFRSTDLLTVCVWTYTGLAALAVGPVDSDWKLWYYLGQAVFWRFTYNWILGGMLFLQSRNKFWSRHFIKYGETPKEAFHHWKIIFNLCQSMTYISYFICAWRLYSPSTPPESWMYGTFLLKHILAFVLVMIHAWTAISIHKTLGDFGWFYGDFFIDSLRDSRSLTYTGVYRFLNHPNAWASTASAWGVTMACESWPLTILTVFGQASNWLFVRYVEGPHMRRQYGDKVRPRNEAGVEKAFRREMQKLQQRVRGLRKIGSRSLRSVMSSGALRSLLGDERFAEEDDDEGGGDARSVSSVERVDREDEDDDEGLSMLGGGGRGLWLERNAKRRAYSDDVDSAGSPGSEGDDEDDDADDVRTEKPGKPPSNLSASVGSIASISSSSSQERSPLRRRKPRAASVEGKPFRVNSFTESMKEAMDRAKPQVDKLVQGAKNIVKRRVERLASVTSKSLPELPLHLYTLTFPTVTPPLDFELDPTAARRAATDGLPEPKFRFLLGDPILIQFTCARETLKRKDWIGIYPVGSNLSDELTTFRSNGRWMFLTGSRRVHDDDAETPMMQKIPSDQIPHYLDMYGPLVPAAPATTPLARGTAAPARVELSAAESPASYFNTFTATTPAITPSASAAIASTTTTRSHSTTAAAAASAASLLLFGKTLVSVRMSSEDQGLRVVTGRLEFRGARIPWSPGVYEARYHCDGGYAVVTRSEPFEVVAERFAWDDHDHLGAAAGDLEARVARAVRDFVERCLDVRHRPMWERGGGGGGGGGRQEEAMPWLEVDDDVMGRCWLPEDVASSSSLARYREEVARRIVYGIGWMFGIEFSWKAVALLGTVRNLARKIIEAKQAL